MSLFSSITVFNTITYLVTSFQSKQNRNRVWNWSDRKTVSNSAHSVIITATVFVLTSSSTASSGCTLQKCKTYRHPKKACTMSDRTSPITSSDWNAFKPNSHLLETSHRWWTEKKLYRMIYLIELLEKLTHKIVLFTYSNYLWLNFSIKN